MIDAVGGDLEDAMRTKTTSGERSDDGCQEDIPCDCRRRPKKVRLTREVMAAPLASVSGTMDLIIMTYKVGGRIFERFSLSMLEEGARRIPRPVCAARHARRSLVDRHEA